MSSAQQPLPVAVAVAVAHGVPPASAPRVSWGFPVLVQALCLALYMGGCVPPAIARSIAQPPSQEADFAPRIDTPAAWQALLARPGSEHIANTEVVKVLLDSSDDHIYFLQSRRWPIHYFFARRFLSTAAHPIGDASAFNRAEYHQKERRFVLGSLYHFLDSDIWAFELYAGDSLDLKETAAAFAILRRRLYFGDRLRYHPVPVTHERDIEQARTLMPVVTTDEIFGQVRYQALELGESYGYVRVLHKGQPMQPSALRPYDILVIADLPEDIPVVSGVISGQMQAPLGHINVLCHNRHTPNMALREATEDPRILALQGKLAHLRVGGQEFSLTAATQAEAERSWHSKRPRHGLTPQRDDDDIGLPALSELSLSDVRRVGAKAAQLGWVAHALPSEAVPRAFALPFHAYSRFLSVNGFDRRLDAMMKDPAFQNDPERRRRDLDALRAAMMAGSVPKDVLEPLLARIRQVLSPGPADQVRLRSSTNAEDLPGFNGAGLYRSTRVDPKDPADVSRGLREVWSSVWLFGAYEERQYARIDHRLVAMGILVQQSIDDDSANGVAITANPFHQGQPGFFINAQRSSSISRGSRVSRGGDNGESRGGSVTGARGDEVPEQILYYTYEDGLGFQRLSKSSLAQGKNVLTDAEIEQLRAHLTVIHQRFGGDPYVLNGRAVDVEFVVGGSPRRVIIVQARPYTMNWPGDRRWYDEQGQPVDNGATGD